ncbi:MAG: hypothetical protein ACI9LN_004589 [Saprospiraceae bacterium]|jgi:hypothetical protein
MAQVIESFLLTNKLEELSVLNSMKLTDKVTKGMLIKTLGE